MVSLLNLFGRGLLIIKIKNMKRIFLLLTLYLLFSNTMFAQIYKKLQNETVPEFAERYRIDSTFHEKIDVTTSNWNKTKDPIVSFYTTSDKTKIEGYAFVQFIENQYSRIFINEYITADAEDFDLSDLFFANVDNDPEDELVIVISQKSNDKEMAGYIFTVYFYDAPNINSTKLLRIDLDDKIPPEFDGIDKTGKVVKTKYRDTKNIFKIIRKLKLNKVHS